MSRRVSIGGVAAALAGLGMLAAVLLAGASAPGLDQAPIGDPECNAANFPNHSTGGGLQEFRPTTQGVSAVYACIETAPGDRDVTLFVRPGTVAAPGEILTGQRVKVPGGTFDYVAFFLPSVLPTPSASYVLELRGGGMRWRAGPTGADSYPRGISSREDLLDFGFRTFGAVPPGLPSGAADQALLRDPPCNATTFRGAGSLVTPLYQEFVPTARGLAAVDLCLNTSRPNERVNLNVRTGTSRSPGVVVATGSTVVVTAGFQWVRITFAAVVPTAPGSTYVLELPQSAFFQWRSTCPGIGAGCTGVDTDLYPQGSAPDGRDYGFRTLAGKPLLRIVGPIAHDGPRAQ